MKHIVLFDGICNLCDWSVQFIIKRDPGAEFTFASLQSSKGKELREAFHVPEALDSVVFIRSDGQVFTESDAALEICRKLNGPVKLLQVFYIFPRPVRNMLYNAAARRRYRIFGKKEACRIPSKEEAARFLD
ncbi:thiol-disulfide oxidoreductase DCC family protein [Alkalicoccus saliphilus]|uniref:Thiol-disulfide oxidoreductase n=1 Tax=Alkalicoccus saliphilus TaxID=200989 RepID=A0A2T4U839_9BACI|nr:thiol-disulfide oxidoreductase DCC family protein [Alkalicoccus saliphilus]PTL39552.1 thiol-disulfide oxidoreductase [Alkalicoccus saliphilus]